MKQVLRACELYWPMLLGFSCATHVCLHWSGVVLDQMQQASMSMDANLFKLRLQGGDPGECAVHTTRVVRTVLLSFSLCFLATFRRPPGRCFASTWYLGGLFAEGLF